MYTYSRQITDLPKTQILVVGSGSADAAAVLASANVKTPREVNVSTCRIPCEEKNHPDKS